MRRSRPPSPHKVRRDWPTPAPSATAARGLQAALQALYGSTTCELGDAGIAERDQRHREAAASETAQACLPLGSKA